MKQLGFPPAPVSVPAAKPFAVDRPAAAREARERTIDSRFVEFHAANPNVYAELVKLARQLRAKGYVVLGIGMLWEVLRWNSLLATTPNSADDFKLNDHYRSRYARLIMKQEKDLAGAFELRELRTL